MQVEVPGMVRQLLVDFHLVHSPEQGDDQETNEDPTKPIRLGPPSLFALSQQEEEETQPITKVAK